MSVLTKIEAAGFNVSLIGEDLAVSPASNLTQSQREFLKSHKAEIITELSIYQKIINWLNSIGENDPEIIKETVDRCKADPDTRGYFVQRADGMAKPH
jgi:hypothetical protein